jgi:protein SHQ1
MITPKFSIAQEDDHLVVTIYAPFTNVADTEIFMEERDFRFFSKPYFLRLHLPGEVEETDAASAKYDADTRSFVVRVPKKKKGQVFQGLDMITELLKPKGDACVAGGPGIETVGGYAAPGEEEEEEVDWYFEQQMPVAEVAMPLGGASNGYGFGFSQVGVFKRLQDECAEILDVKNPDELSRLERREVRTEMESACFSSDHYLCDKFESDEVKRLIGTKSVWRKILDGGGGKDVEDVAFNDKDRERLVSLPRKEYLVDKTDLNSVYFGLVDILFGVCYDSRVTEGERCTESAWNMAKLSPTLACCERHDTIKECVVAAMRRSLCFPLYRHFDLAAEVVQDVAAVLQVGRVAVVRQLLEAMSCMADEGRYVFNQLYLEPYAVWVQSVGEKRLQSLGKAVEDVLKETVKADLGMELEEIEDAAQLTMREEEDDMAKMMLGMNLSGGVGDGDSRVAENDSDDSDSEDSSSSCSSSSEDSSDSEKEGKL